MLKNLVSSLGQSLSCQICHKLLGDSSSTDNTATTSNPLVSLGSTCSHCFCASCLEQHMRNIDRERSKNPVYSYLCPVCGTLFEPGGCAWELLEEQIYSCASKGVRSNVSSGVSVARDGLVNEGEGKLWIRRVLSSFKRLESICKAAELKGDDNQMEKENQIENNTLIENDTVMSTEIMRDELEILHDDKDEEMVPETQAFSNNITVPVAGFNWSLK